MVQAELLERILDRVTPGQVDERLAVAREAQLRDLVASWESADGSRRLERQGR